MQSIASSKASSVISATQFLASSQFRNVIQYVFTSSPSSSRHFYPSLYISFKYAF